MADVPIDEITRESIVKFIFDVKTRKLKGSLDIAVTTVRLLKELVSRGQFNKPTELLGQVRAIGKLLSQGLPQEAATANMVKRIMKIIYEELSAGGKNSTVGTGDSLQSIIRPSGESELLYGDVPALRSAVLEHITEFQSELDTCVDNIISQATEHIHSNEIILTLGASKLVEDFLKNASNERKFHVLVAECAPRGEGQRMAAKLTEGKKIEVTLIADSAIFAVMSRVNKVILGTQTVLAAGGLRAAVGSHTVALAAKHYSVPVVVLCPLYKLSPDHLCNYEQENFNVLASPEGVLPYGIGELANRTHVYCPLYDYVPPDLVTLFITNLGGNAPSYIYRLLTELYPSDDNKL